MAVLLFPDNTVLVNFAIISRMDLLERLANGNGAWCATVAQECTASAAEPGLEALGQAEAIFGSPWFPQGAEHLDTKMLRQELASPGDSHTKHLGEAETLAIMLRRRVNGFFVTDDREAQRLAAKHGVKVASTWVLLPWRTRRAGSMTTRCGATYRPCAERSGALLAVCMTERRSTSGWSLEAPLCRHRSSRTGHDGTQGMPARPLWRGGILPQGDSTRSAVTNLGSPGTSSVRSRSVPMASSRTAALIRPSGSSKRAMQQGVGGCDLDVGPKRLLFHVRAVTAEPAHDLRRAEWLRKELHTFFESVSHRVGHGPIFAHDYFWHAAIADSSDLERG